MKLKLFAALTAAAAIGLAGVADAHGPTRQKAKEEIEINASADKVWKAVGNFQDASWIPVVDKTEGTGGNEKGATRKLTLKGGGATVEEELTDYKDGKTLSYRITNVDVKVLPVTNYSSHVTIEDAGGKTKVIWQGAFYRGFPNNDPPPELSDEAALKAVTGLYKASLENLKKKVEGGS